MIKITNMYLIGLVTASLLVGCGSSSDSEKNEATEQTEHQNENNEQNEGNNNDDGGMNNPSTAPTTAPSPAPSPAPVTAKAFTADVIPVLNAKCKSCHGSNGNFTITTPSATYANISDLKASVPAAGKYLLDKGSNSVGHGGGEVIAPSSAEYATIKSWIDAGADLN